MGDFRVRQINNSEDRRIMYHHALEDIEAFEMMIKEKMFESDTIHIGAEQELCVVDELLDPAQSALDLLDKINDEHYTNELALFNLEINQDPMKLKADCFSQMENDLLSLLQKGKDAAKDFNHQIVMTGILPTLAYRHLQFDYMTPIQRYQTLSNSLFDLRGSDFEIHLQGTDEIIMSLGSVLFEACNTSFQLHLQIDPDDFVAKHNWAQMISGPVLSACSNSPLLFGNELWAESRVALFKQSLDTRSSNKYMRKKMPRVYFGNDWLKNSAAELWKNDIMRFPLIVTSDDFKSSKELLSKGQMPDLRAMLLHNGTTYTWNRLCYGVAKNKAHIRIECRYLPSGPSVVDEYANFAFWIGLMNMSDAYGEEFWKTVSFKMAKNNFLKAARTGMNSVMNWFGKSLSSKQLILETLLPLAEEGLKRVNVSSMDINKYLGIIEQRVKKESSGTDWTVRNFRKLADKYSPQVAQKEILYASLANQEKNLAVHEWDDLSAAHFVGKIEVPTIEQLMTTDILTVQEDTSLELIEMIMEWHKIHHLPVEAENGDVVGLITDGLLKRSKLSDQEYKQADEIMIEDPICVNSNDTIHNALNIMQANSISGLPVTFNNKLLGMITLRDAYKIDVLKQKT